METIVMFKDNETWWLGNEGDTKVLVKYMCEDFGTDDNPKITVTARIRVPAELKDRFKDHPGRDDCGDVRWLEVRVSNEGTIQENVIMFTFHASYQKVQELLASMAKML